MLPPESVDPAVDPPLTPPPRPPPPPTPAPWPVRGGGGAGADQPRPAGGAGDQLLAAARRPRRLPRQRLRPDGRCRPSQRAGRARRGGAGGPRGGSGCWPGPAAAPTRELLAAQGSDRVADPRTLCLPAGSPWTPGDAAHLAAAAAGADRGGGAGARRAGGQRARRAAGGEHAPADADHQRAGRGPGTGAAAGPRAAGDPAAAHQRPALPGPGRPLAGDRQGQPARVGGRAGRRARGRRASSWSSSTPAPSWACARRT